MCWGLSLNWRRRRTKTREKLKSKKLPPVTQVWNVSQNSIQGRISPESANWNKPNSGLLLVRARLCKLDWLTFGSILIFCWVVCKCECYSKRRHLGGEVGGGGALVTGSSRELWPLQEGRASHKEGTWLPQSVTFQPHPPKYQGCGTTVLLKLWIGTLKLKDKNKTSNDQRTDKERNAENSACGWIHTCWNRHRAGRRF